MKYLQAYPASLQEQAKQLIAQNRLGLMLLQKYPETHDVRTDGALYEYTLRLKDAYLRSSEPLAKVAFDSKLHVVTNALGTHTTVSRVQGNKLKTKREIRVASLFKNGPAEFLKMIVVHELAHIKEREHDKSVLPAMHLYGAELSSI